MAQRPFNRHSIALRAALLASACIAAPLFAQDQADPAAAQPSAAEQQAEAQEDEIVVTGARATQRSSIDVKRQASVILDGIVNEEIGALPDNSVADTLERITGVSADRFKGNANELSVRGLGPTLSFSTFNGREVSSAGPDRSVAFQQFPSELMSGVVVYKSQQADFAEGGVAGVIELRSLRPLDYGKQRIQGEFRGAYSPKDDDVIGKDGLGYRANLSFVDQFDTGIGRIGVSLGVQRQDQPAAEDYYNTNSAFTPCNTSNGAGQNCALVAGSPDPIYFATSSRVFRQNTTRELRNAALGALQWQPTPEIDIAIDGQYSKRESTEDRNILSIAEGLRALQPIIIGDGTDYSENALVKFRGNSNIENQLELRQRDETYVGGGIAASYTGDRLTVSADASYSDSHRTETQKATRMRSSRRVGYEVDYTTGVVPTVTFDGFDITDHDLFLASAANSVYARNRFATDRKDTIWAGRLDFTYEFDGFIESIKFGGRYSDHNRTNDNARNNDRNTLIPIDGQSPAQLIAAANANCRAPFPSKGYFSASETNVTRWATFDNDCLFRTFTGSDDALPYPTDGRDPSDIDVTEQIAAGYVMANFRSDAGSVPIFGNVGVRYVTTDITSTGFRQEYRITIDTAGDSYVVEPDPAGTLVTNIATGQYDYWLPSANIAFDLSEQLRLRLAGYRAIARSGIESFGAGIDLNPTEGTDITNIVFNATTGNPNLKPLRAWNLDASLEFYASEDTLISAAFYYKWLKGTVIRAEEPIPTEITATTIVDGGAPVTETYTIFPVAPANDTETRHLYGFEITGSHAFDYLPGLLGGFGVSGSYARAFANFEYPDTSAIGPYVDPANLIGLSKHVANASVYWEGSGLSLRAFYRYRSGYFKPNSGTNREVRDTHFVNLSANYDITKNIQLKAQALNITGERDIFYKGGFDSITEVSESGPVYYFGVRFRY
ncbi:TonB-dependent receptor [Sphingomonas gilva]|uniref:TonB-dependent receptor n=1 Tax=Sphingomonas gilva TaxID=2305907 RepID=A0A396RXA5_9SPHN|nr:TonB-dependent receptor [Sphingomonas gilva]RHW19103.1 TonB-dependent receptor [Sphingomonas gilva]